MTREELEKNLESGREWLKRNGFQKDTGTTWKWVEGLDIDEPDMTDETSVREYMENEELWVCWASFDSEANDEYTQSYGRTPKAAMEEALREWDEEMKRRRHNLFTPISECIQEAAAMRNRLESLVPPMELCRESPRGVFDNSALVWLHIDGEWDVYSRYEAVDGSECENIPAPTGDEIMMRLRVCFGHCVKVNYFGRNRLVQVRCGDVVQECETLAEAALRVYLRQAEVVGSMK